MGGSAALELIVSGQPLPAQMALAGGLLDYMCPKQVQSYDQLRSAAVQYALKSLDEGVELSRRRLSEQPVPFDIDRAEVKSVRGCVGKKEEERQEYAHMQEQSVCLHMLSTVKTQNKPCGRCCRCSEVNKTFVFSCVHHVCVCVLACYCQASPTATSAASANASVKEVQASSALLARTALKAKIAATKAALPSEEHGGLARRW